MCADWNVNERVTKQSTLSGWQFYALQKIE